MVRTTFVFFGALIAVLMTTAAFAATTKLANTTIRANASSTASPVATVPAGTEVQVVSQSRGFTQVKYKADGGWKTGYIATAQLDVSTGDATKALGTTVAANTGYGDQDVASAVNMMDDKDSAQGLMAQAQASGAKNLQAGNEMSDEFDSLPEDVTGAANDSAKALGDSAMGQVNDKKNQLQDATNVNQYKNDAEAKKNAAVSGANKKVGDAKATAEAKKNDALNAPTAMMNAGRQSVMDKKGEVDSSIANQLGSVNDKKDSLAGAAGIKNPMAGLGDMSGVEMLEGMNYSKAEFGANSPFMSEGHLKSKTLK